MLKLNRYENTLSAIDYPIHLKPLTLFFGVVLIVWSISRGANATTAEEFYSQAFEQSLNAQYAKAPLAEKLTQNPKMILFFNDQLFEKLMERWGTLRVPNWDMGRFQDFYKRNTRSIDQWKARVEQISLDSVKSICEPLKVQRKPGAEPE